MQLELAKSLDNSFGDLLCVILEIPEGNTSIPPRFGTINEYVFNDSFLSSPPSVVFFKFLIIIVVPQLRAYISDCNGVMYQVRVDYRTSGFSPLVWQAGSLDNWYPGPIGPSVWHAGSLDFWSSGTIGPSVRHAGSMDLCPLAPFALLSASSFFPIVHRSSSFESTWTFGLFGPPDHLNPSCFWVLSLGPFGILFHLGRARWFIGPLVPSTLRPLSPASLVSSTPWFFSLKPTLPIVRWSLVPSISPEL